MRRIVTCWLAGGLLLATVAALVIAQTPEKPAGGAANQNQREQAAMERFRDGLEKNPKRGTAFDRVYGYHVERGNLDRLVSHYQERTKRDPTDGAAWMILGLIHAQRGQEGAAVEVFRQAEANLPGNAFAPFYLGQALVLVGQPQAAAEAFERAIARQPKQTEDLQEFYQALGLVYQRAQQTDKALATWSRLEKQFPDDLAIQEDIAATLAEEGQYALALPRFEVLSRKTKDRYRQIAYGVEAADLKVKLSRKPDALADYEKLLAQLDPEDWVHREVRRKLEEVFQQSDDLAGLIKYYEDWLKKNGDDAEVMGRLARALAHIGQSAGAQEWLGKAVKIAPKQRDLRLLLIDQYVADQKYALAIQQYEALLKDAPNDPEYVRECGKMHLRDATRPENERKQAAAGVWKRLVTAKPKDAFVASQVAELLRGADLADDAIALYQQAIALAPADPQYVVFLGEYYHTLGKSTEAVATWKTMVEGTRKSAANLSLLTETLATHGYLTEALLASAELCQLDPKNFRAQLRRADLLFQEEDYVQALKQLDVATALAATDEESESALQQQIRTLQAAEKLALTAAGLRTELLAGQQATARRWYQMARYQEVIRQLPEATVAIQKCLAIEPSWPLAWAAAARIYEASGNLVKAIESYRQLATLDRRGRTEYLNVVARLQARLGLREDAFQTGQEVLDLAAVSPENYRTFADLCFQIGKTTEAIDALRKSVRANPTGVDGMLALAKALADQFQVGEAIEYYWKAFDKAAGLESKLAIIPNLTQLHLQTNQFERLLERLNRDRREGDKRRVTTFCVAMVHNAAGDFATARQELERLIGDDPKDTQLLQQLSFLAEREGDLANAAKYQRSLVQLAPNDQGAQSRLAQLLISTGATDEAAAIWLKLAGREQDQLQQMQVIDNLIYYGKHEAALNAINARLRTEPRNWELLYRAAQAHGGLGQAEAARQRIDALLALNLSDDDPSLMLEQKKKTLVKTTKKIRANRRANSPETRQLTGADEYPLLDRWEVLYGGGGLGMGRGRMSLPMDFGQARGLALGWLQDHAQAGGKHQDFIAELQKRKDKPGVGSRALWDWLYLNVIRGNSREWYHTAFALSKFPEPEGKALHLETLDNRPAAESIPAGGGRTNIDDDVPGLPDDQIKHALDCYEVVKREKPGWLTELAYENLATELRRAKRFQDEQRVYEEAVELATTQEAIIFVFSLAAARGDVDSALKLFDRLEQFQAPGSNVSAQAASALARLMERQAEKQRLTDVRRILDQYFATQRKLRQAGIAKAAPPSRFAITTAPDQLPLISEFHDEGSLTLLRQAHQVHDQADATADLLDHLRQQVPTSTPSDRISLHLAMAYLHWFAGGQAESLQEIEAATKLAPDHLGLRFELALVHELRGERDKALAVLDGITAIDQPTLFRKENAALRVAQRLNNVPRAQEAAERLFGLRLNADAQIALAAQMRRLGQAEKADALLARAQRQAGNRIDLLVNLLRQYQQHQQTDLAVQVAMQIMRIPQAQAQQPQPGNPFGRRGRQEEVDPRTEAIQFLARSGRLKDLTERVEAQLKVAPKSMQLQRTLAEYYEAAGDKNRLRAIYHDMAEVRPNDAQMRYQMAGQLGQIGDVDGALKQYRAAIAIDPKLFVQDANQVRAHLHGRKGELLAGLDLAKFTPQSVLAAAHELLVTPKLRDQGWDLYRRAWEAFPRQRYELVSGVTADAIWRDPDFYDYARQGLLPQDETRILRGWDRFGPSMVKLAGAARERNALETLREEVDKVLPKHPDWMGARGLLVLLDLEQDRFDTARTRLEGLTQNKSQPMPWPAAELIATRLEGQPATTSLAIQLYEAELGDKEVVAPAYPNSFHKRLVQLYQKHNRNDQARALLRRLARGAMRPTDEDNSSGPQRGQQPSPMVAAQAIANDLDALGDPLAATQLRVHLLSSWLPDDGRSGQPTSPGAVERLVRQQLKSWQRDTLPEAIRSALNKRADAPSALTLDPFLLPHPHDWPTLHSVVGSMLQSVRQDEGLRKEALRLIDERLQAQPDDFGLLLARTLVVLGESDAGVGKSALERLQQKLAAAPLEKITGPATPRQQVASQPYVALWFVARDAFTRDAWKPHAAHLGEVALDATRRQPDPNLAQAILREWGQLALVANDRQGAEKHWARLFELVRSDGQSPPPGKATVLTGPQFLQAMRLARLAAANGMTSLSLRIARDSLRAGPPIQESYDEGWTIVNGQMVRRRGRPQVLRTIADELLGLDHLWRVANAPAGEVYETLLLAVLPEGRPGEAFVYPMAIPADDFRQVHSAGKLLAQWAVAAGKTAELRERLEALKGKRPVEFASKTLLVQLGLAANDLALARNALDWLAQRAPRETTPANVELAYHAAVPSLYVDELADLALPILQNFNGLGEQIDSTVLWRIDLEVTEHVLKQKKPRKDYQHYKQLQPATHAELILRMAVLAMRAGALDDAVDLLGHVANASSWSLSAPAALTYALTVLHEELGKLPADKRYHALRKLTMPAEGRQSVRMLNAFLPTTRVPASFLAKRDRPLPPADAGLVTSTLAWLLDAAREVGQQDALLTDLQNLAENKVAHAELAYLLATCKVGQGARVEKQVQVMLEAAIKETAAGTRQGDSGEEHHRATWQAFQLTHACLLDPSLRSLGLRHLPDLLAAARVDGNMPGTLQYPEQMAEHLLYDAGLASGGKPQPLALKHWLGTNVDSAAIAAEGGVPAWWTLHDGRLACVTGGGGQCLAYPLTGDFDVHADVYLTEAYEGQLSYGGTLFRPRVAPKSTFEVWQSGTYDHLPVAFPDKLTPGFHQLKLEVRAGKVRCLVNGKLFYEQTDPSPTSPWLRLTAFADRRAIFRNVRITGAPVIPREVKLSAGDRLEGWHASFYREEKLPPRLLLGHLNDEGQIVHQQPYLEAYDWYATAGEIRGRAMPPLVRPRQLPSRLAQSRPLTNGEAVNYEFYYEPGRYHVHPSLGRLTFLLNPAGVQLHWLTNGPFDVSGLPIDNVIDEVASRRGPQELPLKAHAWNPASISLKDGVVTLTLNGVVVMERKLEAGNDHVFGLFHYQDESAVRVRNVVLTGNWPKTLPSDLWEETTVPTAEERRTRQALIGDLPP